MTDICASISVSSSIRDKVKDVMRRMSSKKCPSCGSETRKVTLRDAGDMVVKKGLEALKAEGFFDEK